MKILLLACCVASAATINVTPNGTNGPGCGTTEAPCRTIQFASSLTKPGDVVSVAPGEYQERVYITKSGSDGLPITYQGVCWPSLQAAAPTSTSTFWGAYIRADYVNIECMRAVSIPAGTVVNAGDLKSGFYIHTGRHHVNLSRNAVIGTTPGNPAAGISFGPLANAPASHITATDNYITRVPFGILAYCGTGCVFERNEVASLYSGKTGDMDYARVFGDGVVFRDNYFHGSSLADCIGCHIDCFQTWNVGQYANEVAKNITIEGNVCLNAHQGILVRDQTSTAAGTYSSHYNWTVRGNVFAYGPTGSSMAWCSLFEHTGNVIFEGNLCLSAGRIGFLDGTQGTLASNFLLDGSPYTAKAIPPNWQAGAVDAWGNVMFTSGTVFAQADYPRDLLNVDPRSLSSGLKLLEKVR